MPNCNVCFRNCELREGQRGFCKARICQDGRIVPENYGKISSLALDPTEKKPLNRFFPGSLILSAGSYGCNLRCPFCQNFEITWSEEAERFRTEAEYVSPEDLAATAYAYQPKGNIGVAFTYNEPLIGYEYILDTAKLVHKMGMKNVLVTNGTASLQVLEKLAPYIDAMNIDLKGFTDRYYSELLKGSRSMVMDFIREAVKICHIELTTLIIPGENDTPEEMEKIAAWIAGLTGVYEGRPGNEIPLHISRFFPRFHMQDRGPTDVRRVYELAAAARRTLKYVYTGNC